MNGLPGVDGAVVMCASCAFDVTYAAFRFEPSCAAEMMTGVVFVTEAPCSKDDNARAPCELLR